MSGKGRRKKKFKAEAKPKDRNKTGEIQVANRIKMTAVAINGLTAVATILLTLCGIFYIEHKIPSIWLMFSSVVLYALASCLYWQQQVAPDRNSKALHFKIQDSMIGNSSRGSIFWVRYVSAFGDTLSPMPVAISLIITNTDPTPITIETFTVEIRENRGDWMPLTHIPTEGQRVYFIYDHLEQSRLLDFSENGLDQLLASKSLTAPNQPLKGWLFFNRPLNFDNGEGNEVEFRVTAEDTAGFKYEEVTPSGPLAKNPPDNKAFTLSPSSLKSTGVIEDLSRLALKPWPPIRNPN